MDHDPLMTGLDHDPQGLAALCSRAECSASRPNKEKTFANTRYEGEWSRGCPGPASLVRISAGGAECHMRTSRCAVGAGLLYQCPGGCRKQCSTSPCDSATGTISQGGPRPGAGRRTVSECLLLSKDSTLRSYRFMSTYMPLNAPGSLSKGQYLDLLAYLLAANGYSSGLHELTANNEELKGIKHLEPQN